MTSFQSSELTELPVVENSQLFAQRVHSARTAHGTPPKALELRLAGIFQALQKCVSQRGGFTIELHNVCLIKEGQDKIIQVQLHLLPRMPPL